MVSFMGLIHLTFNLPLSFLPSTSPNVTVLPPPGSDYVTSTDAKSRQEYLSSKELCAKNLLTNSLVGGYLENRNNLQCINILGYIANHLISLALRVSG